MSESITLDHDASRRRLWCCISAVSGIALTVLTFYPGQTNVDAIIQLQQARSLVFNDVHPPLMSWVWSGLDRLIPGPPSMLLLHNLMFWCGLGIVVYLLGLPPILSSLSILAVGLFPPIFSALGTIWKDVGMGAALLLTFALFLYAHRRSSRAALLLGLLPLFYGLAVRHNTAPAVLPLTMWAGFLAGRLFFTRAAPSILAVSLIGVALLASLSLLVSAVNGLLVGKNRTYPIQQLLIHDLTAISVKSSTIYLPEALVLQDGPITLDKLACIYTPDKAWAVFNGNFDACSFRFCKVGDDHTFWLVTTAWLDAMSRNMSPYIEHRLAAFRAQFAIDQERVCYPLHVGIDNNSMGLEFHRSGMYNSVLSMLTAAAYSTPLFRGWVYLCAIGGLLLLALRIPRRDSVPSLVLGSSGLLYGLSYLGVSVTCEFRMHWWLIVAAVVLGLLLLTQGRPAPRSRPELNRRNRGATNSYLPRSRGATSA